MRVNNAPDVPWIQNFDMFCKARYLMIKEHLTAVYDDQILLLVANFQLSILGRNIEMAASGRTCPQEQLLRNNRRHSGKKGGRLEQED